MCDTADFGVDPISIYRASIGDTSTNTFNLIAVYHDL